MTASSFDASVYVLAELEAYRQEISKPITTGTYRLIFGDKAIDARLVVSPPVYPGNIETVRVHLLEDVGPLNTIRFVIGSPDHVIAVGFALDR